MSEAVECAEHGNSAATAVCTHILGTLQDGVPRGFSWFVDEEGEYQAFCSACEDMDQDEWERVSIDLCVILCLECYRKAAAINGVELIH